MLSTGAEKCESLSLATWSLPQPQGAGGSGVETTQASFHALSSAAMGIFKSSVLQFLV